MTIYDESTNLPIEDPDLSAGFVYDGVKVIGYTEETKILMNGTASSRNPLGLYKRVPPQPIYEECQWYHRYTEEELAQQQEDKDTEKRIAALEDELAAAKILLGVE